MITDDELLEIRRRSEAATPGPWRSMVEGRDFTSGDSFIMVGDGTTRGADLYLTREHVPVSVADQDFIAAAREDVPRLLDALISLRRALAGAS